MALQVFLDDIDITADLNKQHKLPESLYDGIHPGKGRNDWYDLLPCIAAHSELKTNFFNNDNGVHCLTVSNPDGVETTVRVLLSMKYTARNR